MMKNKAIRKRADHDELVTKGYLRDTLCDFRVDLKTELKMEFKAEFDDLKMMIVTLMEDNRREHEEMRTEYRQNHRELVELFHEKTDPIFKYIEGNEEDKARINRRLKRLESKVLLA